jgi:two-component system, NarL family, response regulator
MALDMSPRINVLVADDNDAVLLATADLVMEFPDVLVVSMASTVEEAIRYGTSHQPDLALIDAWLRGGGAEKVALGLAQTSPSTAVVAMASAREPELSRRLQEAGVSGCFDKESLATELPGILEALRERPGS